MMGRLNLGPGLISARQAPDFGSLSCEGRGRRRRRCWKSKALFADIRYGARAFSALEGYASRNRETELAPGVGFKPSGTYSHRRGSRLRWEEGRREAGNRLPCVLAAF